MKKFLLSILSLVAFALTGYAADATFDFAAHYGTSTISGIDAKDPMTVDGVTMTFAKGNSQTAPAYNKAGEIRLYGGKSDDVLDGNTITVTAPAGTVITNIVFNPGTSGTWGVLTADAGNVTTATDNTATWTGNAEAVVLTANRIAGGGSTQNRYATAVVTYESTVASSVATPTFSVEAGTYGTKQSVELACESEGAVIYYTLDGTTPSNASTLYEAAIELNTKTTVKAIAYVGEEASNVASATYDFKLDCVLTWNENSPFMQASTMMPKTNFVSPLGTSGAKYWATYDGSEPSADNPSASTKYPSCSVSMYLIKKDTVFTMKVRAEKDGIYGETLEGTFYFAYAGALTAYKGISEMAAGNYVMSTNGTIARRLDGDYGYLPTVAGTAANGFASAFGYFEWTFEATEGGYYIKDSQGKYMYMNGTYNSFNVSEEVPASAGVWTVEINADGTAKIMNVEKQKYIQYSTKYTSWGCYADEQGSMPVLGAAYTPVVTMVPADGAKLEVIDKITFTCPDGIAAGSKYNYCSVQGSNVTSAVASTNQVDANTLEFILQEPITASGEYNFILYKEALVVAPNSLNQIYPSNTSYYTYTVESSAPAAELVVTPENNSTVKSLQNFTFTYEDGIYVNNLFGGEAPFLGFTDPTTGASSQIALTPTTATETTVTLATETAQTSEGYYTLVVPAEYFVLANSKPNDAIMNQYVVSAINPNAVNITSVTPEAGVVTELSKITVLTDTDLEGAPSNWTITDANGTSYEFKVTNNDNDGNETYEALNITLTTAITAAGTYTLNIPAGSVKEYLGSKSIEAQTITWTIEEAVASVSATWSIEEGATIESFESVTITFAGEGIESAKAKSTYSNFIFYEKDADGNYNLTEAGGASAGYMDTEATGTAVKFYIDLSNYSDGVNPMRRKGDYRIVIPAGAIKFNNDNANLNTEEYVLNFTIDNDYVEATEVEAAFTADPANATTVSAISTVVLTFTEYESITVAEPDLVTGSNIPQAFMIDPDFGFQQPAGYMMFMAGDAANQLRLYVDPAYTGGLDSFTVMGDYTIVIPAGVVTLAENTINAQITLNYTVGEAVVEADYIFDACDYEKGAEYETLTDGIFTFLQGEGSTKTWVVDENSKTFSNGHEATKRIKPQTDKNYITADVPAAGKLVFGVLSSSSSATDRTLSVKQNDVELYGKVVSEADKVDGVYNVHEVAVEAGLATITMVGSLNFYYIEFVAAGNDDEPASIEFLSVNPAEGVVTSLKEIQIITDTDLGVAGGLKLTDANGTEYEISSVTNDRVGEDNIYESIIVTVTEEITAAGTYTLTIPAGAVTEFVTDMNVTPKTNAAEKTYTWTIEAAVVEDGVKATAFDPVEGSTITTKWEYVIVTWNKDVDLSYTGAECWVEDAEGTKVTNVNGSYVYDDNHICIDSQIKFVLSTPIENATGEYTLVIGAGYIADMATYQETNEEIRVKYIVNNGAGINGIEFDAENGYVVYNLNGYRVMQTRNAADLLRLENGLYIINGTKVLLNK